MFLPEPCIQGLFVTWVHNYPGQEAFVFELGITHRNLYPWASAFTTTPAKCNPHRGCRVRGGPTQCLQWFPRGCVTAQLMTREPKCCGKVHSLWGQVNLSLNLWLAVRLWAWPLWASVSSYVKGVIMPGRVSVRFITRNGGYHYYCSSTFCSLGPVCRGLCLLHFLCIRELVAQFLLCHMGRITVYTSWRWLRWISEPMLVMLIIINIMSAADIYWISENQLPGTVISFFFFKCRLSHWMHIVLRLEQSKPLINISCSCWVYCEEFQFCWFLHIPLWGDPGDTVP